MSGDDFRTDPARACAQPGVNPDLFFSESLRQQARAKAICRTCPVIDACNRYADDTDQRHGIWAAVNRNANTLKRARRNARRRNQRDDQPDQLRTATEVTR